MNLGQQFGNPVVRVHRQLRQFRPVPGEHILVVHRHAVAENNRVRHAHHSGLQVEGEQHILVFGPGDFSGVELPQRADIHHGAVNDFAGLQRDAGFEVGHAPVRGHKPDCRRAGRCGGDRLLAAVKISPRHMAHAGFGHRRPFLHHPVGVALAVLLDRRGRPAIRVPFPYHRIDRAAQHPGIARLNLPFRLGRRLVGVVRNIVPLVLQLRDGGLQLGYRGADIGQFDQVRRRLQAQLAAHPQIIGDLLLVRQVVGKIGDDAPRQGNVPSFQLNAGAPGKSLENRQQRVRGQGRRFIGFSVNDFVGFRHGLLHLDK